MNIRVSLLVTVSLMTAVACSRDQPNVASQDTASLSADDAGTMASATTPVPPLSGYGESAVVPTPEVPVRVSQFRDDVRAFWSDLLATGYVSGARARQLAYVAVSEAYRHGIPPALVYGVMRVENDGFLSYARSSAGAKGLMQVMPEVWLSSLGPKCGWSLEDDVTSLCMGIYVFAHYYSRSLDWRTALLRYNGCVNGTNTPDCHSYPDKVRRRIEREARYLCPGGDFETCVRRRLWFEFDPASLHVD